jgi:hypothetical protein
MGWDRVPLDRRTAPRIGSSGAFSAPAHEQENRPRKGPATRTLARAQAGIDEQLLTLVVEDDEAAPCSSEPRRGRLSGGGGDQYGEGIRAIEVRRPSLVVLDLALEGGRQYLGCRRRPETGNSNAHRVAARLHPRRSAAESKRDGAPSNTERLSTTSTGPGVSRRRTVAARRGFGTSSTTAQLVRRMPFWKHGRNLEDFVFEEPEVSTASLAA